MHAFAAASATSWLLWSTVHAAVPYTRSLIRTDSNCRVLPGDSNWPTKEVWNRLNQTVGGRLIATVPLGAVCHPGGYADIEPDGAKCTELAQKWDLPQTFINQSGDIMNPWYQNNSCSPFHHLDRPCELGNYVNYAIAASGADEFINAIKFTQTYNVRLVIKNTGHDFLGKSTGKGGLSLWTHGLKSMEITKYASSAYNGPAIKVGAGITGGEVLDHANKAGYRVVTGDCPTVGTAGGYSAGGGHGLLINTYGLGADNVLEWEVITADGQHLTASPTNNTDLYWALTGGGAGTYAAVLGVTIKLHAEGSVGAATLSFNATASRDNDSYVAALNEWWKFIPDLVDAGASPSFNFFRDGFRIHNTTAPNKTMDEMADIFRPYLTKLDDLGVPYTFVTYNAPSYLSHYNATNGPLPYGPYQASQLFNSRLIPRTISLNPAPLTTAILTMTDHDIAADWQLGCSGFNVNSSRIAHPDNAVVSYWRDAVAVCLEFSIYNWTVPEATMLARRQDLANIIHPMIEVATPGSGAYLNEADPQVYPHGNNVKWQDAFYGLNYEQLREVKDRWDPKAVFYAYTAVGSEDWEEDADGRLCRVEA
ncbi:FAD-binding domain-containing protein [Dothidotthia symphoricarpi CBS 119687]|uniref:FAD-binding domain-containing protein n=1 Tax=Dothidotthia symphoricarpi CBS 119687 TaxID=1392245 RepID=A0A6A6AC35_9PLEO|nr:FAD-binding domain-containing protein [Dothidotthia symphoricarpi CBS 119687]KAF2129146.1 FAD-binding domain-containing protein [Dothidotthia symphoricarpi CBS 119687]